MCNASNHPPGCTCGWGGDGHLGRRTFGSSVAATKISSHWRIYSNYVNENAKCPVCGAAVFFYQSPTGGRVFFDDLGPPWPKHPCTDSLQGRSHKLMLNSSPIPNGGKQGVQWIKEGWSPLFISLVTSFSPALYEVSGIYNENDVVIYVLKLELISVLEPLDLLYQSLVQMVPISEGKYRLSLITPAIRAMELSGFDSNFDAVPLKLGPGKRAKVRAHRKFFVRR